MKIYYWVIFFSIGLCRGEDKVDLWRQYMIAVYEAKWVLGPELDDDDGELKLVDPRVFAAHSERIRKAKMDLYKGKILSERKFNIKSYNYFFKEIVSESEDLFEELSQKYGRDVFFDMLGLGFEINLKLREVDLAADLAFDPGKELILHVMLPPEDLERLEKVLKKHTQKE